MPVPEESRIPSVITAQRETLLRDWLDYQRAVTRRTDLLEAEQVERDTTVFLDLLAEAVAHEGPEAGRGPRWEALRSMLADLSRARAALGFTPSETATFVFSFKEPLFRALRKEYGDVNEELLEEMWRATGLLDQLGLYTVETYLVGRDDLIRLQQQEMLELSTPVVSLWDGVLALPLIGTLDSARTQIVMENLLEMIDSTGATVAIVDITGVPTVDTLVAQHLMKTAAAARLMGADVIISGVRPQIAQTIVQLGVELPDIATKASLADAFKLALTREGWRVVREA